MGRVFLVTGCSTGFGRAIAEAALARGDSVALTARRPEVLAELAGAYPERARAFALDVTDPASVRAAVAAAHAAFGRLDVIVNNAGAGLLGALESVSDEQIARSLETNLLGPLRVIRAALPILRAQQGGHIVNLSAIAAFSNEVGFSVYGGAKAALDAVSESLRAELAPFGIKVTLVVPGPFRTDFVARSVERTPVAPGYEATVGKFATLLSRIDGKQTGDPRKAAAAILAAVDSPEPPFRLVLGKYAHDKVKKKLGVIGDELAAWSHVGLPTDF